MSANGQMKISKYNKLFEVDDVSILANTMHGSVCVLEEKAASLYKSGDIESIEDFEAFCREEYFIPSDVDEDAILRNARRACLEDSREINLVIATTLECNFRCPYCFEERKRGHMDEETILQLIPFLSSLVTEKTEVITLGWFGGEPLLYPEVIFDLENRVRSFARKRGIRVSSSITTNGYLLDEGMLDRLGKCGIDLLKITLDGDAANHDVKRVLVDGRGTFSTIRQNIGRAADKGFNILIRVNIDKSNMSAFRDVEKIFEGVPNVICYSAMVSPEMTQSSAQRQSCLSYDEYGKYFNTLRENASIDDLMSIGIRSCMAERSYSFVVDSGGNLYKCVSDIGFENRSCGTLEMLSPCGYSDRYTNRDPLSEDECESCIYYPICWGGCFNEFEKSGKHACCAAKYLLKDVIKEYIRKEVAHEDNRSSKSKDS